MIGDVGDYQHGALVRAEDTDVLTYEDVGPAGVHQLAIGSYDYTLNVRGTHAELQALAIEILVATTRIRATEIIAETTDLDE